MQTTAEQLLERWLQADPAPPATDPALLADTRNYLQLILAHKGKPFSAGFMTALKAVQDGVPHLELVEDPKQ